MRNQIIKRSFRLAGLLLIAMLTVAYLSPVDAAFMSCREDPILVFSDGTVLLVTVEIGTNAANITSINYTVHVAKGIQLVQATYTPIKGFKGDQNVEIVENAQPGQFITEVVVKTKNKNVPVTVTTRLRSQSVSIDGFNSEYLKATVTQ